MSALGDKFRQKAAENAAASTDVLNAPDFATTPTKQVLAIIGQVNSTIYSALADVVDQQPAPPAAPKAADRVAVMVKSNQEVRMAATKGLVTGDWSDFDKLLSGTTSGGGSSGGGTSAAPANAG